MKKKNLFIALVATLLIAALLVVRLWPDRTSSGSAGNTGSTGGPPPLPVFVHMVESRPFAEEVITTGTFRASEEIVLQSEVSGRVVQITFEEGSPVVAGNLLVKLNDDDLQAQLRRAVFRKELAKVQEARQQQLLEERSTSQERVDAAINEVNVLRAEIALIQAQIDRTEIRAPFDGLIGLRYISPGTILRPGDTIATLQNVDTIKVDFSIPEKYLGRVSTGIRAEFTVTGLSDVFQGEVYAIEPRIDRTTRSLLLRALIDNPSGRLLPGGFSRVAVRLEEVPDAIMIPTTALLPGQVTNAVFVLEEGRAVRRQVVTGIRTDREIQIVEGLQPGQTLITSGIQQLRPGLPVRPAGPAS